MVKQRFSDRVRRPWGSRRVHVTVDFRLSRQEVNRAFLWYATQLRNDAPLHGTPFIEDLCNILSTVLIMEGDGFRGRWDEPELEGSEEARAFAERCTARLWDSSRVKEKKPVPVP